MGKIVGNHFVGGEKAKRRLLEIVTNLTTASEVRVGFLEGGEYDDGTSIPLVAFMNEFGASARGQPPRPFFRNMIAKKKGTWGESLHNLLVNEGFNAKRVLTQLGAGIKGQLQQSIIDLTEPPLKPSTIKKKKGVTKPLIDTGVMLRSVDYEVD